MTKPQSQEALLYVRPEFTTDPRRRHGAELSACSLSFASGKTISRHVCDFPGFWNLRQLRGLTTGSELCKVRDWENLVQGGPRWEFVTFVLRSLNHIFEGDTI